jgi:hypothetical protein
MFDNDIENFYKLYKYVKSHPPLPKDAHKISVSTVLKNNDNFSIPVFEMEMTVEKLKKCSSNQGRG